MTTDNTRAESPKTIEEIRDAYIRAHRRACGETGVHYMSIPADPSRDADLILSDAIDELADLRAKLAEAEGVVGRLPKCWRLNEDGELVQDHPIYAGDCVYVRHCGKVWPALLRMDWDGQVNGLVVTADPWEELDDDAMKEYGALPTSPDSFPVSDCYSTPESAARAAAEKGGGE